MGLLADGRNSSSLKHQAVADSYEDFEENSAEAYLWREFLAFSQTWESLIRIYVPLEVTIMVFGLTGNLAALVTLARSRNMSTPSFLYHRAFVFADLVFCFNYFLNILIDKCWSVYGDENQYKYRTYWAAFYSGIVYHAVHITCSYVILYMTVVIMFDRFAALLLYTYYTRFNRRGVANLTVYACAVFAATVNAWSAWVLRVVAVVATEQNQGINIAGTAGPLNQTEQATAWTGREEDEPSVKIYTWLTRQNCSVGLQTALKAHNLYNGATRLVYPFVVFGFTCAVIYGFVRRRHHISRRYVRARPIGRRRERYERTLFAFMLAIVLLAFVQVVSAEFRRFIELIYPPGEITANKVTNKLLPIEERVRYFRILLYGYQVSRVLSNLCIAINHSVVCYLYIAMNRLFRSELLAMLCCCRPAPAPGLLQTRTMSRSLVAAAERKLTAVSEAMRRHCQNQHKSRSWALALPEGTTTSLTVKCRCVSDLGTAMDPLAVKSNFLTVL